MVTENIIGNVLDVLDIIGNDVKNLPKNIADSVKKALSNAVRVPLNSVVELGKGQCTILHNKNFKPLRQSKSCIYIINANRGLNRPDLT